jgi:hypothetical protein
MSTPSADIETLLSRALQPVDPPDGLKSRVEITLVELTELAVGELESWELSAMRDPRNWMRPVIAVVITATAGTALVLLRVRATQRRRMVLARGPADLAARTGRAVASEARRVIRR